MSKCKKCGGARRVSVLRDGEEVVVPCPVCASSPVVPVAEACGAPAALWPGRDPGHKIVTAYVAQLPGVAERGAGLYVTGPANSGKTSALLFVAAAAQAGGLFPVRYYRMRELLARAANNWHAIQAVTDELCALRMLIVDDAFDLDRGWFDAEARKVALDEMLRPFVEGGGALLMGSVVDMDGAGNVWGQSRAGLLDKRLVEVRLRKCYGAAAQINAKRGLER